VDLSFGGVLGAIPWGGPFDEAITDVGLLFNFNYIPFTEDWANGYLAVNRTVLIMLFGTFVLLAFFAAAFANPKVVPGKLQAAGEGIVDFIRGIAVEIIGPEGKQFVPMLTTFFVFIFIMNLFKLTPFIMFPPTSRIAVPLFLALIIWLVYIGVGIKNQGFVGYFKETLFPPGVPKALYILLTPIEFVSNIVLRPFTLAIRLFANMVAGHILVVITLLTIHAFLVLGPGLPVGIFALVAAPLVFGFELFIIGLQAYIFTMLAAVYIGSSVHPAH
jgi:F-type H+-transporting ATPase subunit a